MWLPPAYRCWQRCLRTDRLGKQDNCQVAISLSVANEMASLPVDYRLYLPKDWAGDPMRRSKSGAPEEITFQTKPSIALDQIRRAVAGGVSTSVVLADAAFLEGGCNIHYLESKLGS